MANFNNRIQNGDVLSSQLIDAFKLADNWLIEKHLKEFASKELIEAINECLIKACCYDNRKIITTILNTEILSQYIDFNYKDNEALDISCRNLNVDLVKFLLSSPDLKVHPPVTEPVLYTCFGNEKNEKLMDISHFLIFDLKIQKTPSVMQVLKKYPNKEVQSWFELRELAKKLDKELPLSNDCSNQRKIKV